MKKVAYRFYSDKLYLYGQDKRDRRKKIIFLFLPRESHPDMEQYDIKCFGGRNLPSGKTHHSISGDPTLPPVSSKT